MSEVKVELNEIRKVYETAGPDTKKALEGIFGKDAFVPNDNELHEWCCNIIKQFIGLATDNVKPDCQKALEWLESRKPGASSPEHTSLKPYFIEGRGVFVPIINKVVALHDSFDGKEVKWEKAVKAGAPTRDDWYIILYFKKEINRLLVENGGEAIRDDFYWSSTEHSQHNAWYVYFASGYVNGYYKSYTGYVRAVSAF